MSSWHNISDDAVASFYEWERWGRGWLLFDEPVVLEPPLVPFWYHATKNEKTPIDDGKAPGLLQRIFGGGNTNTIEQRSEPKKLAYTYQADIDHIPMRSFSLILPRENKLQVSDMEQLLLVLSYTKYPCSFEISATHEHIILQIVVREPDSRHVTEQVAAFLPGITLIENTNVLYRVIREDSELHILEFGLREEFMRPMYQYQKGPADPFISLFSILDNLREGEEVFYQVLFTGTEQQWAKSILDSVTDGYGEPFFLDDPDMVHLAGEKVQHPLFAAVVRAVCQADSEDALEYLKGRTEQAIESFTQSKSNRLFAFSFDGFDDWIPLMEDVLRRRSRRVGMLLNSKELLTLVHLPGNGINSKKLLQFVKKTKSPPLPDTADFALGINFHNGEYKEAFISKEQRMRHTHVIGATGTGKSTFLLNCILQDIYAGKGVTVIDPHGDLIDTILCYIDPQRIEDTIVFDPADSEYPTGFNILKAHSEVEKELLASDLIAVFRRLSTSWGDQMNSVFANAILAFLESSKGGTLIDLRRFLIEKSYRDAFLKTVSDPHIVYYWQTEYPLLKTSSIGPILTRLDSFLRPKLIRNMVGQETSLDFTKILNSQKILLVKLSQGLIGAENSFLLGAFIVAKIQQAALSRQNIPQDKRKEFYLYIDEFQNFITPSLEAMLSGVRKYNVGLTLVHQDLQQLQRQDGNLVNTLLTNASTRLCFRLGDTDARRLASNFSYFDENDLQNLGRGEAIARVNSPENDFNLSIPLLPEIDKELQEQARKLTIDISRHRHATHIEKLDLGYSQEEAADVPEQEQQSRKPKKPDGDGGGSNTNTPPLNIPVVDEADVEATIETKAKRKEESEHRYLQLLIKRMAESRGYKALIEEPTPHGNGRVDVHIERNNKKIACEVCVTTPKEWELQNIQKCLAAGYDIVVSISNDKKVLENIKRQVEATIAIDLHSRILFHEPDPFFAYLDAETAKEASTETRMRGYRVKVEYDATSENERKNKEEQILRTISKSFRKKK